MIREEQEKGTFRSLLIILTLAAAFVLWGFFLFVSIGDKGAPPWDFGIVQDIPGESVHSTQSFLPGEKPEPLRQHVSQPPRAVEGERKEPEKR